MKFGGVFSEDFITEGKIKNQATSTKKLQEVLNRVHIITNNYLRDCNFTIGDEFANPHVIRNDHCVTFTTENYFVPHG